MKRNFSSGKIIKSIARIVPPKSNRLKKLNGKGKTGDLRKVEVKNEHVQMAYLRCFIGFADIISFYIIWKGI